MKRERNGDADEDGASRSRIHQQHDQQRQHQMEGVLDAEEREVGEEELAPLTLTLCLSEGRREGARGRRAALVLALNLVCPASSRVLACVRSIKSAWGAS
jgi:hypothetical protein